MAFFVAFYSYKGGVGRTLALANVAYSLASRGKRVVMIDMDLEAPALLGFPKFAVEGKTPKKGFIEYAASYRKRGVCPAIKRYVHACRESPGSGQLWVMPSGRIDASYQDTLAGLPWRRLHPRKGTPPLAEGLRQAIEKEFQPHYVLIDSRTGLSDIGGLSTHLLADMVVLVFNLTKECVEGSIKAYNSLTSESVKVQAIRLVASPIPPVVPSEDSLVEERIRQAKEHMPQAVAFGRRVIRILYDPSMALSEDLAVLKPEMYAAAGRYDDLREEIQRSNAEEIFPILEEAHRRRADGRWDDGLKLLQAFIGEHADDAEAHMELGKFLLEAGRADEASRCFESATKLAGELAIAYRKLGESLIAAGRTEEAIVNLEKARAQGDGSVEVFEALATAYAKLSQTGEKSQRSEARRNLSDAQQRVLSATLKGLGEIPPLAAQDLEAVRTEFITTLKQKPPYGSFDAEKTWKLLASSQTLSNLQKYAATKALIDGKLATSRVYDLMRLLRSEDESGPADLEIRVATEDIGGETRLRFVLNSATGRVGYTHYIAGEARGRFSLREYQVRILSEVNRLAEGRTFDNSPLLSKEVEQQLETLGRELYSELFPRELKIAYREFRDRITTLLVVSDEPWIPWELVKPHDDEIDDDFLCGRFELTRWLSGEISPVTELDFSRIACIEATGSSEFPPLRHGVEESRLLAEVAEQNSGVEFIIISDATFDKVEELLRRGGNGLLHFIGHGENDPADPYTSRFFLTDGRFLCPRDLYGAIQRQIQADRPMVFFNSCLGGWAWRWIQDCGCGALVGPQWRINDHLSYLFSSSFYSALEQGETIGRAVSEARRRLRKEEPGSPAWLAYTAYAHPNARVRLGLVLDQR